MNFFYQTNFEISRKRYFVLNKSISCCIVCIEVIKLSRAFQLIFDEAFGFRKKPIIAQINQVPAKTFMKYLQHLCASAYKIVEKNIH